MGRAKALFDVARGPFLALPVTLVAVGSGASAVAGDLSWSRTGLALLGLVAMHVAVNVLNEIGDFRRGIDLRTERTPFSGGSGALPEGRLDVTRARILGYGAALVGTAVGLWMLHRVGWVVAPVLAAGLLLVFGYTDLFARTGLGEVAAGLGLGGLPVLGTALVQDGSVGAVALTAAVPPTLMTFDLLLLNEFPDREADAWGGRVNLVIVLGRRAAAALYAGVALATPLSVVVGVAAGLLPRPALMAVAASLLLVKPVGWALRRPGEPVPLPALGANVGWNLGTNALLAAGLFLAA